MEKIFLRGIKIRYGNILGSPDFLKEALKKYDRRKGNDPLLEVRGDSPEGKIFKHELKGNS